MHYINKKNKEVTFYVTRHAYQKFKIRFKRLVKRGILKVEDKQKIDYNDEMLKQFSQCQREVVLSKKLKHRNTKARQKHSVYFRNNHFRFIISDRVLRTVEIASKPYKRLNKRKHNEAR